MVEWGEVTVMPSTSIRKANSCAVLCTPVTLKKRYFEGNALLKGKDALKTRAIAPYRTVHVERQRNHTTLKLQLPRCRDTRDASIVFEEPANGILPSHDMN